MWIERCGQHYGDLDLRWAVEQNKMELLGILMPLSFHIVLVVDVGFERLNELTI